VVAAIDLNRRGGSGDPPLPFTHASKKLARIASEPAHLIPTSSCQLNSCGNNDGGGGDSKLGARYTSNMKVHYNSAFGMDRTRNNCMGNTHSTSDNRNNSRLGIQPRLPQLLEFRRKPERQNAARERKRMHLPSMQSKEPFS
jgi:hypothetical protein